MPDLTPTIVRAMLDSAEPHLGRFSGHNVRDTPVVLGRALLEAWERVEVLEGIETGYQRAIAEVAALVLLREQERDEARAEVSRLRGAQAVPVPPTEPEPAQRNCWACRHDVEDDDLSGYHLCERVVLHGHPGASEWAAVIVAESPDGMPPRDCPPCPGYEAREETP